MLCVCRRGELCVRWGIVCFFWGGGGGGGGWIRMSLCCALISSYEVCVEGGGGLDVFVSTNLL